MSSMEKGPRYREIPEARQVELERKPTQRVVITGMESITPLGYADETFAKLNKGISGVRAFDTGHHSVRIAAPLPDDYQPLDFLDRKEKRGLPEVAAMGVDVVRRASAQAGLLGEDNRLLPDIDRDRVAGWIASGVAGTPHLIDIQKTLDERGSERVGPFDSLKCFPEQINGRIAAIVGYSGWGGNTIEACATGASNIIEGARLIEGGFADVVIAGGFEEVLRNHPDVSISMFGSFPALSRRNDDPEGASRPYDKDRDGFVHGSGGGIVILESLEHARQRNAAGKILAEIDGYAKSMDGETPTGLAVERVTRTVQRALYDEGARALKMPDAIFAHATSTVNGDRDEAKVFEEVFGDELGQVPVTAIKSNIGHTLGGAGAANIVEAILALNANLVPPIRNLDNPDEELPDLSYVTGKPLPVQMERVLTTAFGFGGHNAVLALKRYGS